MRITVRAWLASVRTPAATTGLLVAVVIAAGCIPAATGSPPAGSPSASATTSISPSTSPAASSGPADVTSPEAAAAAVVATNPGLAGIGPVDPDVIGACCSWSAVPTTDGWRVTFEAGWGDCPAGCIDRHHWTYSVTRDGAVVLLGEDGPPVPAGVPGSGASGGGDGSGLVGIRGIATAGPVCPVVRPDDPACADRPVAGATVHVLDATGTEVAQLETDASGAFTVTLPGGRYRVQADPIEGMMQAPGPVDVDVTSTLAFVQLAYDTGIR